MTTPNPSDLERRLEASELLSSLREGRGSSLVSTDMNPDGSSASTEGL